MTIACGIDLVSLTRFQSLLKKDPLLQHQLFTEKELACFVTMESRAGVFAAKEAIIKAHKKPLSMNNIEILKHADGSPYISYIEPPLKQVISSDISISHDEKYVVASCCFLMQ